MRHLENTGKPREELISNKGLFPFDRTPVIRGLEIDTNASLQSFAKRLPYENKIDLERELADLRKAGLQK